MADSNRRALKAWREEKKLTPDQLWRAGAGLTAEVITRWERTGEMPAEARGRCIQVAQALGIPVDALDLGQYRRGFTEAGYEFVLTTRGRDDRGWEATIQEWRVPNRGAGPWADAVAQRAGTGMRTQGPTLAASLDALETELRELIQTNPPDSEGATPPA